MPYGLKYHFHRHRSIKISNMQSTVGRHLPKGVASKPTRPVIKRDQDGNIVARYKSLRLASESVGKTGTYLRNWIVKGRAYQEFFYEYE